MHALSHIKDSMWLLALLSCLAVVFVGDASAQKIIHYDQMGDWLANETSGGINLSTFIYTDRNRNGVYDIGDQPFSGAVNHLIRDGAIIATNTSNPNGFANFRSSKTEEKAPIRYEGEYSFKAIAPPGFVVSSGNATQKVVMRSVFGSIAGIVADRMPDPIGFMPVLSISGQASSAQAGDKLRLTPKAGGASYTSIVADDLSFHFQALEPDEYTLVAGQHELSITLGHYPLHVGDVAAPRSQKPINQTASFDDISLSTLRKVPNGYKGLKWFNLNAMRDNFTKGSIGYINGIVSPNYNAYTSSGHPAEIYSDKSFALQEVAVSVAWPKAQGETLIVEYYNGDQKLGEDEITLSIFTPTIYRPNRGNVTKIVFTTKHYWQAVLEDVKLTVPAH